MKNKNLIVIGVIVILVIVGGGYFFLSSKDESEPIDAQPELVDEIIETISAEELGLTIKAGTGNRTVIMEVANLDGISALDYELSYTAKGDLPRGVVGNIEVTSKDKTIRKEITLGTCSDVCHYDEDVSDIKLILKVTKEDGKVYHAEETLEI